MRAIICPSCLQSSCYLGNYSLNKNQVKSMLRFLFCLNLGSDPNRLLIDYFFLNIHTSDTTNNYTNTVMENELMLSLAL